MLPDGKEERFFSPSFPPNIISGISIYDLDEKAPFPDPLSPSPSAGTRQKSEYDLLINKQYFPRMFRLLLVCR
jgi:hypothetical protein